MEILKLQNNSLIKRDHFKEPFSYFVIESIIEGNTLAEAYVDQLDNPRITIVWDTKHGINCGGSADKDTLLQAAEFIIRDILTQEVRQNSGIVKIAYENQDWKEALLEYMKELSPAVYPRSIYKHRLDLIPSFPCMDNSIIIKKIDAELLNNNNMQNIEGLIEELELMWGKIDNFLLKGFGFCAIKGASIAAWCTGEYFSKNWCGIGIETYKEYQSQGIATATAIELVKYCREINKTPHWDSWKGNTPSVKTAEKAGFDKLMDYEVILLRFI